VVALVPRRLGPARLAGIVGVPASTVHRVLVRHGVNRLVWMDRPTKRVIRRIETCRPGELVHIDVKKLARVPNGGGHKVHGRAGTRAGSMSKKGLGYSYVHTAIDAYSRLAYSEFAGPETTGNCVGFLNRALAWFSQQGITTERILTDNGNGYRSEVWRDRCAELGIVHTRTRPYHPATNGKAERFIQTMLRQWAYAATYQSSQHRRDALPAWLGYYNRRPHSALGHKTPASIIGTE
jgi:transposase InsO family protein